jgi:phospholipase C
MLLITNTTSHDWFDALAAGNNLAAVSYLKAQSYQDGHPGNSNPLDEQAFVVNVINTCRRRPSGLPLQ